MAQDDTVACSRNFISYCAERADLDYTLLWDMYGGRHNFYNKYSLAQSLCEGAVQDRVLARLLFDRLKNVVDKPVEQALNDYLNGTGASGLKPFIEKEYRRQKRFGTGLPAPAFDLPDPQNNRVSLASFRGKIVLLDFWFANCMPCLQLFRAMRPVKEHFRNNPDVVFLNVSIDLRKEEWTAAISRFGLSAAVNVFTEGQGDRHPILKDYGITGYPAPFLIDRSGRFFSSSLPHPLDDNGQALIRVIEQALGNSK